MTDVLDRLRTARPLPPPVAQAPSIEDVWRKISERAVFPGPARTRGATRHVRLVVAVSLAGAVAATILFVGVIGRGPSEAFAGWRAKPTVPRLGEIPAAESACPVAAQSTLLVADVRGPFSLLLYLKPPQAGDPAGFVVACLPTLHSEELDGVPLQGLAPSALAVANVETDYASFAGAPVAGSAYTDIVGQVGSTVTGVTLDLQDGSQVQATTTNGWFAAWWPGQQSATTAQALTPTGTVTSQISVSPHPSASSNVGRALAGN
jgi:hypothetical protein